MARQALVTRPASPAELLPPGLRGALTPDSGTQAPEQREPPVAENAQGEIDPQARHRMISEAAYRLYARRGMSKVSSSKTGCRPRLKLTDSSAIPARADRSVLR